MLGGPLGPVDSVANASLHTSVAAGNEAPIKRRDENRDDDNDKDDYRQH